MTERVPTVERQRGVCDLETGGARASRGIKVLGGLGIVETRTSQESSTDETESRILMLFGGKKTTSVLYTSRQISHNLVGR
jgi:hypothetical protein